MSIITVSQRDRGFGRLGPDADPIARGLRAALEKVGYESEIADDDIWVRYAARRTGFPEEYSRILAACRNAPARDWDLGWTADIDPRYDATGQFGDQGQCQELIDNANADPDFRFLHWIDASLVLCRRADREQFLREHFLPAFFDRFPEGRIVFVRTDSALESRVSTIRQGNYLQINGRDGLRDMRDNNITSANTAAAIHSSGVVALDKALSAILGNLMPLRTHFVGGRMGIRVVYLFGNDDPPVIDRGPFPRDEADLFSSQIFFRDDGPSGMGPAAPLGGWLGRFRNTDYPGDDAVEGLVAFLLERFNAHLSNRIEVCNHVDQQDTIDFTSCFEKYLTLDRLFLECVMVATATNSATARLMTFAVLDKFQELCHFTGIQPTRGFHYMCTRPFLNDILLPAFASLPVPWDAYFRDIATAVYDDLYATIRSDQGVWPNCLVQAGGGVRVYRKWDTKTKQFVDQPVPLTDDEFIAEYVRAARNTHHGYISDGDRRRRFACFGSISTGLIPDSFTQLPLLIMLADCVSPALLSGRNWLDQGALTLEV